MLQDLADEALRAAVVAERANGTPWEAIGKALGTSRSGAHGRFSLDVNDWQKQHPRTAHEDALTRLDSSWTQVEDLARQQLFLDEDRLADTEQFLRHSVAEGSPHAATGLAQLLVHTGRSEEAENCLRDAAVSGNNHAAIALADLLSNTGRAAEAEALLRAVGTDGDGFAPVALAELLTATGRAAEAEEVLRHAVDQSDGRATTALARLLLQADRNDEAEQLLAEAARLGNDRAAAAIARLAAAQVPGDVAKDLQSAWTQTIHLACHGTASALLDEGQPDSARWVLALAESDRVDPLVFLSACRSAHSSETGGAAGLIGEWLAEQGRSETPVVVLPMASHAKPLPPRLRPKAFVSEPLEAELAVFLHLLGLAADRHDHRPGLAGLLAADRGPQHRTRNVLFDLADDRVVPPAWTTRARRAEASARERSGANRMEDLEERLARIESLLAAKGSDSTDDPKAGGTASP